LIQTEIEQLSYDDYNLKTYLHKSINEGNHFSKLFPEVFLNFKETLDLLIKGLETQRGYRYKPTYKLKQYYLEIIELLIKDQYNLSFIKDMSEEDAEIIFREYLTPDVVFDTFCIILLKFARDTMFTQEENTYNEKSMTVIRHQVIYHIYSYFSILAITHSIHFMFTKSKKVIPLDSFITLCM
jgi:hypothetical protein